jgi:arylsulfatase
MLTGEQASLARDPLLFFDGWHIQAVRWGPWKLHVARYNSFAWTQDPLGGRLNLPLRHPELYNVDEDPGETMDIAEEHADVVMQLRSFVESALPGLPVEVRNAWKETNGRRVQETPAGALPRLEGN